MEKEFRVELQAGRKSFKVVNGLVFLMLADGGLTAAGLQNWHVCVCVFPWSAHMPCFSLVPVVVLRKALRASPFITAPVFKREGGVGSAFKIQDL